METKKRKRLPYGNSNFESVRTENYVYIDKTRYIELLENEENKNLFFIRPRKFGKSLFFTMLSHYYDINKADKFEQLFGDLYIGQHPTPRHNTYMVLNVDFSNLDTSSEEKFNISLSEKIQDYVRGFLSPNWKSVAVTRIFIFNAGMTDPKFHTNGFGKSNTSKKKTPTSY